MATNPTAGLSDPAILRKTEAQLAQAALIANGKPTVSGSELILPSTTVRTTSNAVITTTSANNDPGDTVTVYTAPQGGVYVSSIDQTIRQTVVNNPIAGVTSIVAGGNVSISSTGAGGTGEVTINASLTGLGNISTVNLDGNASNVLHGDGSWSADQTTYSNSNVVSLLSSFGSNTITTTGNVSVGNIIGNGQALTGLTGANVSGAVGLATYATTANSVAGANVSGEVSYAATANSVAVGNVSGLGNIATTNFNGTGTQVLAGNGAWVDNSSTPSQLANSTAMLTLESSGDVTLPSTAKILNGGTNFNIQAGTGGVTQIFSDDGTNVWSFQNYNQFEVPENSNIWAFANLGIVINNARWQFTDDGNLNVPGNLIYTGASPAPTISGFDSVSAVHLSGEGGNISNIQVANVFGLGTIATTNLDGNVSNVLYGDGTFGAVPAGSTYGDSNVVTLLGSFGSNTITTTGVITADGYGLSNVPYANITGTPSLGNVSVLNLDGNASNLLTGAGTYVAIPVVPTLGNIATINIDGSSSNILYGNGVFAAVPASTYGDSNVVTLLSSFGSNTITTTGNVAAGAVTASGKIGYSAGANVTQTTSRSTSVTINGLSGEITLFATSMSVGQVDFFTVTNNQLEVGDMIICTTYAGSAGTYLPMAFVSSATQAVFTVRNLDSFVTASESPVIKFIVIKAPKA